MMKKFLVFVSILFVAFTISPFTVKSDQTSSSTVSLTVPAQADDFETDTTILTPIKTTYPQDTTITYQITYQSHLPAGEQIVLKAHWADATVGSSAVSLATYVTGSATNAYNNTAPVVNLTEQTITWTISSLPKDTEETVTFSLKTTDSYTEASSISFDTSSYITAVGVTTTNSTVSTPYLYVAPAVTPTPTSSPTSSTTSTPTPTLTPTITPSAPAFSQIDIRSISSTSGTFQVFLSTPEAITVYAGKTPTALSKQVTSKTTDTHLIELAGLLPETTYYIRFRIDSTGTYSDIYSFTTAQAVATIPAFLPSSLIISSQKNIMNTQTTNPDPQVIILPPQTPWEIRLKLSLPESIKTVQVMIRKHASISFVSHILSAIPQPQTVLGATTNQTERSIDEQTVTLVQIQPGIYVGKLKTNQTPGAYGIYMHIRDRFGSIQDQHIATIAVVTPLTVLDASTNKPIEHAKIFLSIYNAATKEFEEVSPLIIELSNPTYTDSDGIGHIVLPAGKYLIRVSALNYDTTEKEFTIGNMQDVNYPTVYLKPQTPSIGGMLSFYSTSFSDLLRWKGSLILATFAISPRYFNVVSMLTVLLLCIVSLLALYGRTHLAPWRLPSYAVERLHHLFNKQSHLTLSGKVLGEKGALSGVMVIARDPINHTVMKQSITNKSGIFLLMLPTETSCLLSFMKDGYEAKHMSTSDDLHTITLEKATTRKKIQELLLLPIANLFSFFFECLLLFSIISELLLIQYVGVIPTIPFLAISLLSFFIWLTTFQQRYVR